MTLNSKLGILIVMKVLILLSVLAFLSCSPKAEAKKCNKAPIKIAVIDTGFGFEDQGHTANLCKYGHKDFSSDRQFTHSYDTHDLVPLDVHGHGTNIAGIIDGYAKEAHVNYCLIIIKYYSSQQNGQQNLTSTIRALNYAANIHADYINYSGGGPAINGFERAAIKRFLNQGGKIVAAAGNEGRELQEPKTPFDELFDDGKTEAYYPAMYDKRIIVVGNLCKDGVEYIQTDGTKIKRCRSSNYGDKVTRWETGEDITAFGITMTGTSQATATATGKIVAESSNKCDIGF